MHFYFQCLMIVCTGICCSSKKGLGMASSSIYVGVENDLLSDIENEVQHAIVIVIF